MDIDDVNLVDAPDPRVREYIKRKSLDDIENFLSIPTNDDEVKRQLRSNGAPPEVRGETKLDRRKRLATILAEKAKDTKSIDKVGLHTESSVRSATKLCVSPAYESENGSPELTRTREVMASYVGQFRSQTPANGVGPSYDISLDLSQSGFQRPVAAAKFLSEYNSIAVGDWSGNLTIMDMNNLAPISTSAWQGKQLSSMAVGTEGKISTGYLSGEIRLYSSDGREVKDLDSFTAHKSRITSQAFHPVGGLLATASQERVWKLWDIKTLQCVWLQDGHQDGLTDIKISPDGSVLASSSTDGNCFLWDLRSGIPISALGGHAGAIVTEAWNPSVYSTSLELVTCGEDNRSLVWDLRSLAAPTNIIYAHNSRISEAKFDVDGRTLITSSLDGSIKFWDRENKLRLRKNIVSGSRIMCVDVTRSPQGLPVLVAGRWDRMVDMYR